MADGESDISADLAIEFELLRSNFLLCVWGELLQDAPEARRRVAAGFPASDVGRWQPTREPAEIPSLLR